MTFKQRFASAVRDLLFSVSVAPEPSSTSVASVVVSQPLYDAIREIEAEVAKDRTDWHLVAALTGVKSYICGLNAGATIRDPFWEQRRGDDDPTVYGVLDGLHFRAASHVGVLPSGMTLFAGTPDGIGKQSGEVDTSASPTSPTLRLIAEERARIEAEAAERPTEIQED